MFFFYCQIYRKQFLAIENNYLYLSASIIIASVYIYDHKNKLVYNQVFFKIQPTINSIKRLKLVQIDFK